MAPETRSNSNSVKSYDRRKKGERTYLHILYAYILHEVCFFVPVFVENRYLLSRREREREREEGRRDTRAACVSRARERAGLSSFPHLLTSNSAAWLTTLLPKPRALAISYSVTWARRDTVFRFDTKPRPANRRRLWGSNGGGYRFQFAGTGEGWRFERKIGELNFQYFF